ncbi:Molecular chaperone GrpE (modular protein) [Nitrosopumilaceae archaeon]|nr:Molecular chaperone GrpE (modular protein) [Nitrosopumilaceae archaeon]
MPAAIRQPGRNHASITGGKRRPGNVDRLLRGHPAGLPACVPGDGTLSISGSAYKLSDIGVWLELSTEGSQMEDPKEDTKVAVEEAAGVEAGEAAGQAAEQAPAGELESRCQGLEEKLKHAMADYQNLERKVRADIENGVNARTDMFMQDFLTIRDELALARGALSGAGAGGVDSILKKMDTLLSKHKVAGIEALGEIFDPAYHEAVSSVEDPALDENTVTREIRKGYISGDRVIRPTLVEISRKV